MRHLFMGAGPDERSDAEPVYRLLPFTVGSKGLASAAGAADARADARNRNEYNPI